MAYRAVTYFTDLLDHAHEYHAGDPYPRKGLSVSPGRLRELAGNSNRRGIPLIEEIKEKKKTRKKKATEE